MPAITTSPRNAIKLGVLGICLSWATGCRTTGAEEPAAPALPDPTPVAQAEPQQPSMATRQFSSRSRAGTYLVTWESVEQPIPLNELFELDVTLALAKDPDTLVTGAQVYVQASMPQHNHGMLREPRAREVEPGRYRVEGMLLHMTGYWQISLDVVKDGIAETTDFELTLE